MRYPPRNNMKCVSFLDNWEANDVLEILTTSWDCETSPPPLVGRKKGVPLHRGKYFKFGPKQQDQHHRHCCIHRWKVWSAIFAGSHPLTSIWVPATIQEMSHQNYLIEIVEISSLFQKFPQSCIKCRKLSKLFAVSILQCNKADDFLKSIFCTARCQSFPISNSPILDHFHCPCSSSSEDNLELPTYWGTGQLFQ